MYGKASASRAKSSKCLQTQMDDAMLHRKTNSQAFPTPITKEAQRPSVVRREDRSAVGARGTIVEKGYEFLL